MALCIFVFVWQRRGKIFVNLEQCRFLQQTAHASKAHNQSAQSASWYTQNSQAHPHTQTHSKSNDFLVHPSTCTHTNTQKFPPGGGFGSFNRSCGGWNHRSYNRVGYNEQRWTSEGWGLTTPLTGVPLFPIWQKSTFSKCPISKNPQSFFLSKLRSVFFFFQR